MRLASRLGIAAVCLGITSLAGGGQTPPSTPIEIPPTATLEGVPTVRIDSDHDTTTRRELDAAEAAKDRLTVRVVDGQIYWSSRDNRLLRLESSGPFTYLSSSEPGRYIRLSRVNDRITYVEHVDFASRSVTWWGELRIVVGR